MGNARIKSSEGIVPIGLSLRFLFLCIFEALLFPGLKLDLIPYILDFLRCFLFLLGAFPFHYEAFPFRFGTCPATRGRGSRDLRARVV